MGLVLKIAAGILLAVLVSVVACGALISSSVDDVDSIDDVVPANPESGADEVFLTSIRPSYSELSDEELVERGRQVCRDVDGGARPVDAAGGDPVLAGAAIGAYCTEHFDKL
jgi:hypothetical protein